MFTGIVEALGEVVEVEHLADSARLTIRSPEITSDAEPGGSIAVNGVCLTVTGTAGGVFDADVMQETLKCSALTALTPGARVNLERSVRLADRLGGHLVQGHVDATAAVISRSPGDQWDVVRIALPPQLARYVVEKGSICVDGISLTVSAIADDWFEVSLIPETLKRTTLGFREPGDTVNLEVDVIAKYVEKLLTGRGQK
ncbi:MAG TPA: riboflavin synthase [Streptosporangiaceae bacterium]|jgi:riboflavin synthase|nr:riboflavin synthase [Streptosporangiaceae bacterium]